jgi:aspartyl aminopeptidase
MSKQKKSKFSMDKKSAWLLKDKKTLESVFKFSEDYKKFISENKTERECVKYFEKEAISKGFINIENSKYEEGNKIFIKNNKNMILSIIGKKDLKEGINLIIGHIDSPRLDLKPVPLFEENNMALLKTQYYGGIKKYQWVNIPLAIHGTIIKKDGTSIDISIGENDNDPVFTINDILPHLAKKVQGDKKLLDGIEGENLRVLVGNIPVDDDDIKEQIKENILIELNKLYGITEEDFISAELELVPAYKAKDIGFDRSMIGSYGHDDRVCSYAAFRSMTDLSETPEKTTVVFLVDKEEIGSFGVSGITSKFLYNSIGDILGLKNPDYKESELRKLFANSFAISADVGAVINPMFKTAFDETNAPNLGFGVLIEKYTGSGGKYSASDASAELVGKIRKIFNDNSIIWQPSILGKVDEGGGGTIAMDLAELGVSVIDCGIGVDGMHSPFETISKVDLYEAYKAYIAFLINA